MTEEAEEEEGIRSEMNYSGQEGQTLLQGGEK